MSYGPNAVFELTMTSGATLTTERDLGRSWKNVYLSYGSLTSNTQMHIQASEVSGGTYRRVYHPSINNASVQTNAVFAIGSSVTSAFVPIPNGLKYVKVETTATMDSGYLFKIVCTD